MKQWDSKVQALTMWTTGSMTLWSLAAFHKMLNICWFGRVRFRTLSMLFKT